jgi:hypothetical protein
MDCGARRRTLPCTLVITVVAVVVKAIRSFYVIKLNTKENIRTEINIGIIKLRVLLEIFIFV